MTRTPLATGVLLAAIAALAFGATTPVVAWAGRDLGPLATAALLYLGAALTAGLLLAVAPRTAPRLRRGDAGRLIAIAMAGAAVAPALLAWGLQRTGATVGALLLNLEAVATVILARVFYREPIGPRVGLAVACMAGGGAALAAGAAVTGFHLLGVLAVGGATVAWALDNTWTRPLAERDPFQVILVKATLGAGLTAAAAGLRGEPGPSIGHAAALLACGASGYGASLYLYLLAQRRIGAARTGSVFALAPFIGAAIAWTLGDRGAGTPALVALGLFALGAYLHLTEHHAHRHVHEAIEHDHVHRHDDDHHAHRHEPAFYGPHAHRHRHEATEHDHAHAPDLHHVHDH